MVTPVTEEVLQRQRTGKNYWTIPGLHDPIDIKPETLDECIRRVFQVSDIELPTRRREIINARHFKRYVLERLDTDEQISNGHRYFERNGNKKMKYSVYFIANKYCCDHATVLHSSRTAQNLIDTDKDYRCRAEQVFRKIRKGLIIFP